MTFFLQFFPDLVKNGHVYILETPLFRVRNKQETHYCYDEAEKQAAVKKLGSKPEITRFKGLGEISPDEFARFIGADMRVQPVMVMPETHIQHILEYYMGKNTQERQEFIINNLKIELDLVEAAACTELGFAHRAARRFPAPDCHWGGYFLRIFHKRGLTLQPKTYFMKKELIHELFEKFEQACYVYKDVECWSARELQILFNYSEWRNFVKVIDKAKEACENAGSKVSDHFVDINKMVPRSGSSRSLEDMALTRYACYLIAQNGDPFKDEIAFAQTYFAVQTRSRN